MPALAARALVAAALLGAMLGATGGQAAADPLASSSIVGGHKADPQAWGFAVALRQRGVGFFCTGSLIAPDRVLTAAHCMRHVKVKKLRVVPAPWASGGRARPAIRVRRVRKDPDYNGRLDRRDVAVMTLRSPAPAPTIQLATGAESRAATKPGRKVFSAGWGARSPWGFRLAKRLMSTKEGTLPNRLCRSYYGKSGFNAQSMICVLGSRARRLRSSFPTRRTSCSGDSGGPLVAHTARGPRLVGVVSAGPIPCGYGPSIYARVSAELKFIRTAAELPDPLTGP